MQLELQVLAKIQVKLAVQAHPVIPEKPGVQAQLAAQPQAQAHLAALAAE
jgi:hypothetical protein